MAEIKNIHQRMLAIQSEMETVGKNLNVGYGTSKYKAVRESDVLRAVKELENKHRVYSYPIKRKVIHRDKIQTKNSEMIMMEIETIYRFVNIDNAEEYIEVASYGDGVDTMDKAPGKAMTYADKYALMKAYKIETGEDPDQTHSDSYKGDKKTNDNFLDDAKIEEDQSMTNYQKYLALKKKAQELGVSKDNIEGAYKLSLASLNIDETLNFSKWKLETQTSFLEEYHKNLGFDVL